MKQFFVLVATLSVNAEAALLAHLKRTNNKSNTKMAVQGTVRISPSLDAGTTDALNLVEIAGRDQAFLDAPLGKNSRKAGNQRFDRETMGELFKNWEKAGGVDHAGMMNFLGSQNPADYQSNLTQILDQMDAATNTSHDAAQLYIDGVAADFHHCDPTQNGTLDQYKKAYEDGITPHNTCRDLELDYKTKLGNCTDMKKNFDEVNGNPSPATTCAVDGPGGESMEKWLDRMAQKFDTLNTTWHAKSEAYTAAQALVPGPGACNDATYTTKKSACDLLYVGIEDNACLYAFGTQSACIGYDDCYEDKASAFRNATNITIIGESERKLHWAGVQRIRCVLDALVRADESKLTACLSAVGSDTSHLNITYPAQPAEVTCAAPTEYPCTADFNNAVFNGFPAGLAKPTCNTCQLPVAMTTTTTTTTVVFRQRCAHDAGWTYILDYSDDRNVDDIPNSRAEIPAGFHHANAFYIGNDALDKLDIQEAEMCALASSENCNWSCHLITDGAYNPDANGCAPIQRFSTNTKKIIAALSGQCEGIAHGQHRIYNVMNNVPWGCSGVSTYIYASHDTYWHAHGDGLTLYGDRTTGQEFGYYKGKGRHCGLDYDTLQIRIKTR